MRLRGRKSLENEMTVIPSSNFSRRAKGEGGRQDERAKLLKVELTLNFSAEASEVEQLTSAVTSTHGRDLEGQPVPGQAGAVSASIPWGQHWWHVKIGLNSAFIF